MHFVKQPRFREKSFYVKLTTFSTAKETKYETKLITDSERSRKINMRLRWTVFKILLTSTVIPI